MVPFRRVVFVCSLLSASRAFEVRIPSLQFQVSWQNATARDEGLDQGTSEDRQLREGFVDDTQVWCKWCKGMMPWNRALQESNTPCLRLVRYVFMITYFLIFNNLALMIVQGRLSDEVSNFDIMQGILPALLGQSVASFWATMPRSYDKAHENIETVKTAIVLVLMCSIAVLPAVLLHHLTSASGCTLSRKKVFREKWGGVGEMRPASVYENPAAGKRKCACVLFVQICLVGLVVSTLVHEQVEDNWKLLPFELLTGLVSLVASWTNEFGEYMVHGRNFMLLSTCDVFIERETHEVHRVSQREARLRIIVSSFVNVFVSGVIVVLLPAILTRSDSGIDFVKDCLAIGFIIKLDDVEGLKYLTFESGRYISWPGASTSVVATVVTELDEVLARHRAASRDIQEFIDSVNQHAESIALEDANDSDGSGDI
eukprot:TRINITY_DN39868_c0_g1_i1.p1 TRINITY_DN39868_c0_g1~~TRINITY_DN39868_c0_g1_i1.p1  ORF type:complete len:437 (-),score=43.97 TRINITY_DN39868_c0_g1_i1:301-1584(-)